MLAAILAGACSTPGHLSADRSAVRVVTSTALLADLVRQVGGSRVHAVPLVPMNADPRTYEPSLRDVANVVRADIAFDNYPLLEHQGIIKALEANLRAGVPSISLAEGAVKYAAEIIQLVEDSSLDAVWLGMRVVGSGARHGATRSSDVVLRGIGVDGPGELTAYLTEAFGNADVYLASSDGFDAGDGHQRDAATLPPDAHTHMSWAFSEPGIYRLTLRAELAVDAESPAVPLGERTFTFAVAVDPYEVPGMTVEHVVDGGHADVAVDLDRGGLFLHADRGAGVHGATAELDPLTTVVFVPPTTYHEIPSGPGFRFLGAPGDSVYQLPQAVLGRHVHGEIDPHLWHDVHNVISYSELIRDRLTDVDPAGAAHYRRTAAAFIAELEALHAEVAATIAAIPKARRHLVTTHDTFRYLGQAYDVAISGFVTANPATEPSMAARRRLAQTIRSLGVRAVFVEPGTGGRSSTLAVIARESGADVCPLYGGTLDESVPTYVELMRFNAASLHRCLARS